jgi:hypothetical protein
MLAGGYDNYTGRRDALHIPQSAAAPGRYVPLRPLCDGLCVQLNGQIARIRRDEVMAEGQRLLRVETEGGPQTMQALHLESMPLWLAGLEPSRVRAEMRPRLRLFKSWVRPRVWEAFAHETGIVTTSDDSRTSARSIRTH